MGQNKRLSAFFNLEDFVFSETALKHQIDNWPKTDEIGQRLAVLCHEVLDHVAQHFKTRPQISSGYRCPVLNAKVGGVDNSQHVHGYAADFEFPDHNLLDVARWIQDALPYDQLLLERAGGKSWIHVSYVSAEANRREVKWFDGTAWHAGLPDAL